MKIKEPKNPATEAETVVKRWIKEITTVRESKAQVAFETIGQRIVKNYRNADSLLLYSTQTPSTRVMFNILWSNVQVLKPTLYSRMPKVVVERRFKDSDPVGRLACQMGERATSFMISTQQDRFNHAAKAAVEDRLLPGRGIVWLRYDTEFEPAVSNQTGEELVEDGSETEETVTIKTPKPGTEKIFIDSVNWLDYLESPARNVFEVRWKARRCFMSRSRLIERFGDIGKEVNLDSSSDNRRTKLNKEDNEFRRQAEVWEIWDDESKKVFWISEGYESAPLDERENPYKLDEFFPCPLPLLATTTTDSTYPTPDYKIYEKLADEYDYVTKRTSSMADCIRLVGMSAASLDKDIKNMLKLADGQLWPIENWQQFMEQKGGIAGAINWFPFDQAVAGIQQLLQYGESLLTQIYEITGIPDVVRGSTDPNETLGAQQEKSHWTVVKIAEKQADVQRFCRQIISKIAELLFEPGFFSDETIALMAGVQQMTPEEQQLAPAALALLRNDQLRTFRVDIETDSTIASDEEQDKQARMEYIQTITGLVQNIQNVSQFRPELLNPVIQSALFAARAFRTGRQLEGAWEGAMSQIEQADKAARENPQPPPPDPAMMQIQVEQQSLADKKEIEFAKLQQNGQKLQSDFEIASKDLEIKAQGVMSKQQIDQMDLELKQFAQQFEQYKATQEFELQKYKTILDEKEKFIEEDRLKHEQVIATIEAMKADQGNGSSGGGGRSGPVSVNVHTDQPLMLKEHKPAKRRLHSLVRTPTGFQGESVEIPDEETPLDIRSEGGVV